MILNILSYIKNSSFLYKDFCEACECDPCDCGWGHD